MSRSLLALAFIVGGVAFMLGAILPPSALLVYAFGIAAILLGASLGWDK